MKDLLIYGSGGLAREVAYIIYDINLEKVEWNIVGFIDDDKSRWGKILNGIKVLGDIEFLNSYSKDVYVIISIADPKMKKRIVEKISSNVHIEYPTIIHPGVKISDYSGIGEGCVISYGCILSTNCVLGNHVFLNFRVVIGHDAVVEKYASIMTDSIVSGDVEIKEGAYLGTGVITIQNISIGKYSVIGAGAVVTKDIPDNTTVFGCPAWEIKKTKKIEACLSRLPEYIKRLKEIEEKLKQIHHS